MYYYKIFAVTLMVFLHFQNCKYKSWAVAEMGDHLATIDNCQKLGAVPILGGTGSPSHSVAWAEANLHSKWYPDAVPLFFGGGSWYPSNTKLLGPRPTSIPSGILIHPAVWPQQTWAKNWGAVSLLEGTGSDIRFEKICGWMSSPHVATASWE